MALFLNTPKLNHWIPKLIEESEDELILIVPYIQISEHITNALNIADANGVEITLVYRENKLSEYEKNKLLGLKNINLLHHPNVHCKCYYNGDLLIVGSLNLYDYSEKNNREMGMLMHRYSIEDIKNDTCNTISRDTKDVFDDAITEIRQIINSASLEKASEKAKQSAFQIDIIKTDEEQNRDFCERLNTVFLNKKFEPFKVVDKNNLGRMTSGDTVTVKWFAKCDNFFDKVDVVFEHRRIAITFNLEPKELNALYNAWQSDYDELEFHGFKYYWNSPRRDLFLYKDNSFDWNDAIDDIDRFSKHKEGITSVINKYRQLARK